MANYSIATPDLTQLMAKTIEAGASLEGILQQLQLAPDLLEQDEGLIPLEDAWRILIANQNAINEESHLISSRPLRQGSTRLVFSSLHQCTDLEQALNSLADNYNIIHGGQFNSVHKHGNHIHYRVDDRNFHYQAQPSPLAIEFALIRIHCALSILNGTPLTLASMNTRRQQLPDHEHHLLLFDTDINTKQDYYQLSYPIPKQNFAAASDECPDLSGNIYAHYLSLLQQTQQHHSPDFVIQCLDKIRQHSAHYDLANQEIIAAEFNTSVASLRRKLKHHGSSFRQLLDKVNSETAIDMIHNGHHVAVIADTLGYSDERSFKRAFKRWHQLSPAAFIKNANRAEAE